MTIDLTSAEAAQFEFHEVDGRAVVVDTQSGDAWAWEAGAWHSYLGLVYKNYAAGPPLGGEEFFRRFPDVSMTLPRYPG